jgi:high-affinity iron transporter
MRRLKLPLVALAVFAAGVAIVAIVTRPGHSGATTQAQQAVPTLAVYEERSPHVLSELSAIGQQSIVDGVPLTPKNPLAPLAAAAFRAPVAAYLTFAGRRLGLMEHQIALLAAAVGSGDRAAAQAAWRGAFADYLQLGAVYLEGPIATLDEEIDGSAGGVPGGTASPSFTGLHRIEFGLWTGAPLGSLTRWIRLLASDVGTLRRTLPSVPISPLDYATRAHEILEDAVRDLLSGTDVPWSGEGVLGTQAGIAATTEVIDTLRPLLGDRENVLPVVYEQLQTLDAAMAAIRAAHGGQVPTNQQLTQLQSERLDGAIGGALEALAQVPGALETAPTPVIARIPRSADRTDPTDP